MLRHLHIQNYALISHLDIDFESGFSVMTGETGAGKSIILGALNLVMGGRADTKTITEGEDKCVIEADFGDSTSSTLVRRELNTNGRSRTFVNDELVTQSELKTLAAQLIDIHSQHESLLLGNNDFQLSIVDSIANNSELRNLYTKQYNVWLAAKDHLLQYEEMARKTKADADYIQFQFRQLNEAHLQQGELADLEQEQYNLAHAEDIRMALQEASNNLDGDECNALSLLQAIHLENADSELAERLRSVEIELRDIAHDIERKAEHIEANPMRLQEVEERIALLHSLLKKHNVQTEEDLIALRDQLDEQCNKIDSFDEEIAQLKQQLKIEEEHLLQAANTLTQSRVAVRETIANSLIANLKKLGVIHAQIEVQVSPLSEFTPTGLDDVQFLFAANLNQHVRRVCEVASGGELSRLMLCIKSLVASTKGLPTIIFDEIDTGVSGEIAAQMGRIMQEMAHSRQIITITHLPQIAALGNCQFKVYKTDTATRTETHIRRLSTNERIDEIATMLSGKEPTKAALENAKQLLNL